MKMRKIFCCLFAMALLIVQMGLPAVADVVSPGNDFYYLDDADVLSEATEGEIFFSNQLLEKACGAQIVIVAIDTTGNQAIDDYAYELFNEWGIGDDKENNGFLLLMAIEDDDYYAMAGTGLDIKFSSGTIGSYLDKYLEPDFADKDYDDGVKAFFEAAFSRIADVYGTGITVSDGIEAYEAYISDGKASGNHADTVNPDPVNRKDNDKEKGISPFLIVVILVVVLIILSSRKNKRRRASGPVNNKKSGNGSYVLPFVMGRVSNAKNRTTFTTGPGRSSSRSTRSNFYTGGFGGSRPGGGKTHGFGIGRSGGFSSGRSGVGSSGRSGFGGSRGGGGGSRGGGAGRGRR